jgi:hypothetical protein
LSDQDVGIPDFGPYQSQEVSQGYPSLWERFTANVGGAFRGTSLGAGANYVAGRLAPDTVPIDPNTGQPINAASPREQVRQSIMEENARLEGMPSWTDQPGGLGAKALAGTAALAGSFAGGVATPESLVGGPVTGLGLRTLVRPLAVQAGTQAAGNVAAQGLNIAGGTQEAIDVGQAAEAAVLGAAIPLLHAGVAHGLSRALDAYRAPREAARAQAVQDVQQAYQTASERADAAAAPAPLTTPVTEPAPIPPPPVRREPIMGPPEPAPVEPVAPTPAAPAPSPNGNVPGVNGGGGDRNLGGQSGVPVVGPEGRPVDGSRPAEPVRPVTGPEAGAGGEAAPAVRTDGTVSPAPAGQEPVLGGEARPGQGAEPARPPAPAGVAGPDVPGRTGISETVATATGRKVDTRFEVIDAADLKPAGGDLQPRDRAGRAASDAQIAQIAANLDPARLHSSAEADRGAPIIGPDNIIESGNGRVSAIRAAYQAGRGDAYRAMIHDHGFDTTGMQEPVLVRRRTTDMTPEDRQAFVREPNQSATARMSAPEQAAIDAKGMTADMLARYDHSLAGGPLAARNRDFVRSWVATLPEPERNAVMGPEGALSQEGVRRIQGAMLAKAYGDKGTLSRMLESPEDNTKTLTGALTDAAPAFAKLHAEIEAGRVPPEFNVSQDLVRAVELVSQARERGQQVRDVLTQQDAFNPISPQVEQFVRAFHNEGMTRPLGRPQVADVLRRYATEAARQSAGGDLLGGAKASPADVLTAVRKAVAEGRKGPDQGNLLGKAADMGSAALQDIPNGYANRIANVPPAHYDPTGKGGLPADPSHTDRPSTYTRQVYAELGIADPDGMVSKPVFAQQQILRAAVKDKYGLANVRVEAGANPREIIDQLADAHRNLSWMAQVMGVPDDAIGLRGKLSIWVGRKESPEVAMGQGRYALGIYRPDNRTIYLPGRTNSFAHEWTHALDHALSDALAVNPRNAVLLSRSPADWHAAPPGTSSHAFAQLMGAIYGKDADKALAFMTAERRAAQAPTPANARALAQARQAFHATDYYRKAQMVSPQYLAQPYELLARSHEAYISKMVTAAGGDVTAVAKPETAYLNEADRYLALAYPKGDERNAIFSAWDNLHNQLREDALYSAGTPASSPLSMGGMGPPHWPAWADTAGNQALTQALRTTVVRANNQASFVTRGMKRLGFDQTKGSDPGYLTRRVRAIDAARAVTFTWRGMMNTIHDRVPDGAKPYVRSLIDAVTTDPGSARTVRQTFEEETRGNTVRDHNLYSDVARKHDLLDPTEREAEQIHAMMTQREDTMSLPENIQKALRDNTINQLSKPDQQALRDAMFAAAPKGTPDNVKRFAADMRFMLDNRYYDLRRAGLEIPYTEGYFPRMYDDYRVYSDRAGFEADAAKAKAIQFERDTENDPDMLRSQYHQLKDDMDPQIAGEIQKRLREHDKDVRNGAYPAETAEDLLPDKDHRDAIAEAWGKQAATEWGQRIVTGYPAEYDTRGPRGQPLRGRSLPPETDAIMRKWLVTDPHQVLPHYFNATNRKIAFVKRFGATGEGIDTAIEAAVAKGMRPEDGVEMRRILNNLTGEVRRGRGDSTAMTRALDTTHALGTMALMPRAVFTQIAEPMSILLRTGSVKATAQAFTSVVRDIMRTAEADRIDQAAKYIGLVTASHFDSIQHDRVGSTYTDSQGLGTMMTNYFRRTGLTALTNSQRRGALVAGHTYIHSLAVDLQSGKAARVKEAQAQLRDLGLSNAEQNEFAKWLAPYDHVPSVEDMEGTVAGGQYRAAVTRFVNQVIQDPTASEKPMVAANPFGRLAMGLMNFNYVFYTNVVDRFFKEGARRFKDAEGFGAKGSVLSKMAAKGVAGVGALWAGSMVSTVLREAMFNGQTWDEREKDGELGGWLADLAFQRIGLNGPFDPLIQAITSQKYQKSFASLTAGAQVGYFLEAADKMVRAFTSRSPETNTADYNAIVGAYQMFIAPLAAVAMTAIPGGPMMSAAAAAAGMHLTSKNAADRAARTLVGPKGSTDPNANPDKPIPSESEEGLGPEPTTKPKSTGGSSATTSAIVGLGDDFAPLIARNWARLPGPLKVGGAVVGGALAAKTLAQEFARFTAPPRK